MASAREMRLRIKSVKNISQVTRALQAVSASKVRKAIAALMGTRPYATKAWQVLTHISASRGEIPLHPLLTTRAEIKNTLVVLISGDRGLAGAYNTNLIRLHLSPLCQLADPGQLYCGRAQGTRFAAAPPPDRDC
jgi:F-type H+-transporting ATPase subunit gamma